MYSLGISPGDGLKLLEYHESSWFIKEVIRINQKNETTRMINEAEAHRMAIIGASSKKNLALYNAWVNDLRTKIADPAESGEETLFDRLKKESKKKKPLTLFEKLKNK